MNRPRISTLSAASLLLLGACTETPVRDQTSPDSTPLDSSAEACREAGGFWAYSNRRVIGLEHCQCPEPGAVFVYDPNAQRGDPRAQCVQMDRQAKMQSSWVFSVPGKRGTLRVPGSDKWPEYAPHFIVPGVTSSLEWQSIPENGLFFTHGLTSAQRGSGVTVVGYDLQSERPGAAGKFNSLIGRHPIRGRPKGLNPEQSKVYVELYLALTHYADNYEFDALPLTATYDRADGDCLISCRLSIHASEDERGYQRDHQGDRSFRSWINDQIRIEVEMVGGVRAHKRLAFYSKSDPTRLLGIVTLNLNFTVGLIGIGPEEGVRPMEDPGLSTFKFFDAEGNEVLRRTAEREG